MEPYVANNNEKTIDSINEIDSGMTYYGDGMDIEYWIIDAVNGIRPIHTYISEAKRIRHLV